MDIFTGPSGSTPLPAEDQQALRQTWIATRAQLNEAEQANILAGLAWAQRSRVKLTDEAYLMRLHQRMFGDVWKWAGKLRRRETNIGVMPHQIAASLREFLSGVDYWLAHDSYDPDEIAARYHHGLVFIHPFVNGNGRHTRLAADLMCSTLQRAPFTWGSQSLDKEGAIRSTYLSALRAADVHDFAPLLAFVRS